MPVHHIGIIIGGAESQTAVNEDHAKHIADALSQKYTVKIYDLHKEKDIAALLKDKKDGKLDIVFNNAAGKLGGDGTVEGYLELMRIPFVGSDTLATAVAFDKITTKAVVKDRGVKVVRGISVHQSRFLDEPEHIIEKIEKRVGYPMIIKASQGSDSIGVSLVKQSDELIPALRLAFKEDDLLVIEDFVRRKAEVTCMVIGNNDDATALPVVERVYETEILYTDAKRSYRFPKLDEKMLEKIMRASLKAHRAVGCSDYSRSDFLITKSGTLYFLELNAHAGLGDSGPTAYVTKNTNGWSYAEMIEQILQVAIKRYGL
ncbi:D-alanine--D-alanine ligase [soil metagenome]